MIYGYEYRAINEDGLKHMREISVAASPLALRHLAQFLIDCADQLESSTLIQSHRHIPDWLEREIGCDVIVLKRASSD